MDLLSIGQSIIIKRSCGRLQTVKISALSCDETITVEWNERGDLKGKEVTLHSILPLNPMVFSRAWLPPELMAPQVLQGDKSGELPMTTTYMQLESKYMVSSDVKTRMVNRETLTGIQNRSIAVSAAQRPIVPVGASNIGRSIIGSNMKKISTPNSARSTRSTLPTASPSIGLIAARCKAPTAPTPSRVVGGTATPRTANRASYPTSESKPSPALAKPSSKVVKKVENLKDNREKRRALHAEIRQQKEEIKNRDPGNPNWEVAHMIREYQKTIDFNPLHGISKIDIENRQITVCVRKRPLRRKELMTKEVDVISVPRKNNVIVHEPKNKVDLTKYLEHHKFRFDYVFDELCGNDVIYQYTARPLVKTIFEGGRATCFAYGQTGSGKTHTMGGEFNGKSQVCGSGIYAMAARDVFAMLKSPEYRNLQLSVSCSFFEIYGSKVFDLLTSTKTLLRVLEDGKQQVQICGLTERVVHSVSDVLQFIEQGSAERTSGQTSANANSSRSHAVFQILLRKGNSAHYHGKFSFIDLAGNERGADTFSSTRETRMEGADINKSLLALKECIRAMGRQKAHLPFRVSKLTQVLRDSFIGGEMSKTCMIAMISPGLSSCEHTLNTLRYADRVKELIIREGDSSDSSDNLSESMETVNYGKTEDNNRQDMMTTLKNQDCNIKPTEPSKIKKAAEFLNLHSYEKLQNEKLKLEDDFDTDQEHEHEEIQACRQCGGAEKQTNFSINCKTVTGLDMNFYASSSENETTDDAAVKHVTATAKPLNMGQLVLKRNKEANEKMIDLLKKLKPTSDTNVNTDQAQEVLTELADVAAKSQELMRNFRDKMEKKDLFLSTSKKN